jgi:hypothetical protein
MTYAYHRPCGNTSLEARRQTRERDVLVLDQGHARLN